MSTCARCGMWYAEEEQTCPYCVAWDRYYPRVYELVRTHAPTTLNRWARRIAETYGEGVARRYHCPFCLTGKDDGGGFTATGLERHLDLARWSNLRCSVVTAAMEQHREEGRRFIEWAITDAVNAAEGLGGVYLIRGRGRRRYVGQTNNFKRRRANAIALGQARLIIRLPDSASEEDRLTLEAWISHRLLNRGRVVVNSYRYSLLSEVPGTLKKLAVACG